MDVFSFSPNSRKGKECVDSRLRHFLQTILSWRTSECRITWLFPYKIRWEKVILWKELSLGQVEVPKDYDLFKGSQARASVSLNEREICLNGHSAMFIVPNRLWWEHSNFQNKWSSWSHFEVTSFIPHDICRLLQQKGVHTLEELEDKLKFNRTLELPPSPSFLGIKLLDLLNVGNSFDRKQLIFRGNTELKWQFTRKEGKLWNSRCQRTTNQFKWVYERNS